MYRIGSVWQGSDHRGLARTSFVCTAKGVAQYTHRARPLGAIDHEADVFLVEALFSTVTNVNFDPARLEGLLRRRPPSASG